MNSIPDPPSQHADHPSRDAAGGDARRWPLGGVSAGVLAMLAFLAATNHWYGWDAGIRATQALDTETYARIAAAAPGFPNHDIGSAFTERFAFPWVLGAAGDLFGGGPHVPFRIMFALFVAGTLVAMVDISRRLGLAASASLLCVGLFALNPYVFRGDAIAPGPVDEAFVLGIAILIWGLIAVRFAGVMAGAIVAILGRQSALIAVPAAAVWLYVGSGWSAMAPRRRLIQIAAAVGSVLVIYGAIKLSITSFTYGFAPSIPSDTVIPFVGHPGTPSAFATHIARIAAPLVLWAGALIGAVAGLWRAGGRFRPPAEFWCAILIGASIIAQPLIISPHFPGFEANEQRLSALGLLPLCVGLAYLLRDAGSSLRRAPAWALVLGAGALLAASLHDRFTVIGPSGNGQFIALELIAAAVIACVLAVVIGGGPPDDPAIARERA
ncbi:MAG: hypothetical protein ACRDK1_08700 [Solirubrobacterales bacterium]